MFASSNVTILAGAAIDIDATLGFQMFLFLALLIILRPLLINPYLKAMDARKEGLEGSREDANEFEIRAEKALADYEKKMRDARREAQEVRDSLRGQGTAEQNEIVEEARAELATKIEGERTKINDERKAALAAMTDRAEGLAGVIVEKVLPA